MSSQEQTPQEAPPRGRPWRLIAAATAAAAAAAAGFLMPNLAPQLFQGDTAAAGGTQQQQQQPAEPAFIEFGEAIVNLNSDRFNRYLKTQLTLQVAKQDREEIELLIEKRRSMLKGWLLSHLADKTMEEIRGAAGQNRLRREIHHQFNTILYSDGRDPVEDVYFEEFNVQ